MGFLPWRAATGAARSARPPQADSGRYLSTRPAARRRLRRAFRRLELGITETRGPGQYVRWVSSRASWTSWPPGHHSGGIGDATIANGAGGAGAGGRPGLPGRGAAVQPRPPLLLPLLLLPAQLLADAGPALAGAARGAVHAPPPLLGLPAVPGAALAL